MFHLSANTIQKGNEIHFATCPSFFYRGNHHLTLITKREERRDQWFPRIFDKNKKKYPDAFRTIRKVCRSWELCVSTVKSSGSIRLGSRVSQLIPDTLTCLCLLIEIADNTQVCVFRNAVDGPRRPGRQTSIAPEFWFEISFFFFFFYYYFLLDWIGNPSAGHFKIPSAAGGRLWLKWPFRVLVIASPSRPTVKK